MFIPAMPINVAVGATATFDISFDVDAVGAFNLDLHISNNDSDENPYNFVIQGTGIATCTFSGTINLQSRSDDSGVTFTAVGASAGTFSTTTDAAGYYELAVPQDTYNLSAEMDLFLDSVKTSQYCPAGGINQPSPVTLLGGDTNDDCIVNILDLAFIGARFWLSIGDPGFDPKEDINADGTVNILDLTVAGANFQKTCPVDWP